MGNGKDGEKNKKKSGFFDFIFNTAQFVDDIAAPASDTEIEAAEPIAVVPLVVASDVTEPAPAVLAEQSAELPIEVKDIEEIVEAENPLLHANGKFSVDLALVLKIPEDLSSYIARYDHYHLLGIDSSCTQDTIRASYLRLSRKLLSHDVPEEQKWKQEYCATVLSLANQVLSDPLTRSQYDPNYQMSANFVDNSPPARASNNGAADIAEIIRVNKLLGQQTTGLLEELTAAGIDSEEALLEALLTKELLSETQIESIELIKHLMAVGKLKQTQLELITDELCDKENPIWATLVAKGWIKPSDIL